MYLVTPFWVSNQSSIIISIFLLCFMFFWLEISNLFEQKKKKILIFKYHTQNALVKGGKENFWRFTGFYIAPHTQHQIILEIY